MKQWYGVFLLLFTLAGCTSQPPKILSAWLKPGVNVTLPSPGLTRPINEQQLLTANVKGKSYSLIVLLDVNDQRLNLAGLSSLGIRLFTLNYDAHGIQTEQSIMLPDLPPTEQVLLDIMLSYWPIEQWRQRLPKGWTLTDANMSRELRDEQQQRVSTVTYALRNGIRTPISIDNHPFGYHIKISRLEGSQ